MYTPQDYLLFFLALALFLGGVALLGTFIEWRENRKAKRQDRVPGSMFGTAVGLLSGGLGAAATNKHAPGIYRRIACRY